MKSAQPLARFLLVDTSCPEEIRAAFTRTYGKPNFKFLNRERKFHTVINQCKLDDMALIYASCAADLCIEYPETDLATQIFSVDGKCQIMTSGTSITVRPDCSAVISAREPLRSISNADYKRLCLTIKSRALANKLSAIVGEACAETLRFNPRQDYALYAATTLRAHFFFLIDILNKSTAPLPQFVLSEFEQTLMVMFLQANRHNYSQLLEQKPRHCASWQVDRVEAYIEANWRRAITLESLADISGVSAFSLFRSFKNNRGYSPMEFLRRVRLRHARELLLGPDANTTVAEIASTCGFADPRRFEGEYVLAFGESPLEALDRGKNPQPLWH
ncbi:MAG: AraC family transcriptional regulator [Xanthobacteraceae bacterium]